MESCPVVKIDIDGELLEFINAKLSGVTDPPSQRAGGHGRAYHHAALLALTRVHLRRQAVMSGMSCDSLYSIRSTPDFKAGVRRNALEFGAAILKKVISAACAQFSFIVRNADACDVRALLTGATENGGLFVGQEANLSEAGYMGLLDVATVHLTRALPAEAVFEGFGVNYLILQNYVAPLVGYAPAVFGGKRRKYAAAKIQAISLGALHIRNQIFLRSLNPVDGETLESLADDKATCRRLSMSMLNALGRGRQLP